MELYEQLYIAGYARRIMEAGGDISCLTAEEMRHLRTLIRLHQAAGELRELRKLHEREEGPMLCPLTREGVYQGDHQVGTTQANCSQADCAWWEESIKGCSVKAIAREIAGIHYRTTDLVEQVKH